MDEGVSGAAPTDRPAFRIDDHLFELIVVVLMSLTAVATAWAGYQTAKWSGMTTASYSRSAALRTEATRISSTADRQRQVDVSVTIAWVEALADGDQRLADFLRDRFPARLQPAADAWLAALESGAPDATVTPVEMPQYAIPADAEVNDLLARADAATAEAHHAADRVDRYVMMGVFFAVVLLLGALSAKLDSRSNRVLLLGLALVGFVAAAVVLSTLPVEL